MNIFSLIIESPSILISIFIGRIFESKLGTIGFYCWFLISFVFCRHFTYMCIIAYYERFPLLPSCVCGNNMKVEYRDATVTHRAEYVCKCNERYVHEGRHFFHVKADGSLEPFMIAHGILRVWKAETGEKA